MSLFYQIFITLFSISVRVSALFNKKTRLFIRGRKNLFKKLKEAISGEKNIIWIHCSSLGEFEQARPLIEKLKTNDTDKILITFFSPSGYEIRKNYTGADYIFYLPIDTKRKVKRFLTIVSPKIAFFVKYDFWYNYLHGLNTRKIPTYLISANFRAEQFSGFYGIYLKKVLSFFTGIFVQNQSSYNILQKRKINHAFVSGDLRYDRVYATAQTASNNAIITYFKGKHFLLLCGSTWEKDEEVIAKLDLRTATFKIIITPHQVGEEHILSIIQRFNSYPTIRYSKISKEPVSAALDKLNDAQILIVDTIGMLATLYKYADIAYIGGGFGSGIHNVLEAVAFGVPVMFGPNHHKFPEAKELIELKNAFEITTTSQLSDSINTLLSDSAALKTTSVNCKNFVEQRRGATEFILTNTKAAY